MESSWGSLTFNQLSGIERRGFCLFTAGKSGMYALSCALTALDGQASLLILSSPDTGAVGTFPI